MSPLAPLFVPGLRVEFWQVPGSTDIAVMVNGKPVRVLTAAQYEEFQRRVAALGKDLDEKAGRRP